MHALPSLSNANRWTSIGLVAGLHVLLVLGLSGGLLRAPPQPQAPPQVDLVKEDLPPPEPPPPIPRDVAAVPTAPQLPLVPIAVDWVDAAPTISVQPADQPPQPFEPRPARVPELQGSAAQPLASKQPAGLLCPTQARPQLPASAQAGSAQLRVTGTVIGGRVAAVQMEVLRALPDRRAQRALLAEVEQTLRNGYACTQDGVFEQEFVFRVDD